MTGAAASAAPAQRGGRPRGAPSGDGRSRRRHAARPGLGQRRRRRASAASATATASPTSAPTASACARPPSCDASAPSRSRRRTRTSGSARAPNGHLQATGRDARGRKQYRYHPDWRLAKDADKFERMLEFGAALPRIRKRVAADLAAPVGTMPRRETVLATIVRLLDTTYVRIGNEEYARDEQLVRPDDAAQPPRRRLGRPPAPALSRQERQGARGRARRSARRRASSGAARRCRARSCSSTSTRTARCAASARPTSTTTSARRAAPTSRPRTSAPGTARRTRSRSGSSSGARRRQARPSAKELLGEVAKRLGNTVAVCKKSYVHPRVLEVLAQRGRRAELLAALDKATRRAGLSAGERRLLAFLARA